MNVMKKNIGVLLPVMTWIILLVAFLSRFAFIYMFGASLTLEARPVDPVDLFRGNYVALSYPEVSRITDEALLSQLLEADIEYNDEVYVLVDAEAQPVEITGFSQTKPDSGVFLKGKVERLQRPVTPPAAAEDNQGTNVPEMAFTGQATISYGIEEYFVRPALAQQIERELADGLDVYVKVDPLGRSVITGIEEL